MTRFIGIIVIAVGISGCTGESPSSPTPGVVVPLTRFTTEPSSFLYFSGLNIPARLVVDDQSTWRAVWSDMYGRVSEVPPVPDIDFSKEEILVAALGTRGSSGYSIVFQGASGNDSGGVDVIVQSGSPGKGCAALTVLTQPVDIARIPRVSGAIHFVERTNVSSCGQ
jgi:hypothetical protein